jgi:hypothetical protein
MLLATPCFYVGLLLEALGGLRGRVEGALRLLHIGF